MLRLVLSFVLNAIAIWVAAWLVSGIELSHGTDLEAQVTPEALTTLLLVAVVFVLVNAVVKPILKLISLPLTIITLGLFLLVINALMLMLTSWLAGLFDLGFSVEGFWPALLGGIVIGIVNWLVNLVMPDRAR